MCGIAGWVGAGGANREVLDAMLKIPSTAAPTTPAAIWTARRHSG